MNSFHVDTKEKAAQLNQMYKSLKNGHAGGAMFIKYYLDGCPACINFKPAWDKASGMAKHKGLHSTLFIKLNANMLPHVDLPKVQQFPTVKLFSRKHPHGLDFNEDRTAEHLLSFIKQHTSIPVRRKRGRSHKAKRMSKRKLGRTRRRRNKQGRNRQWRTTRKRSVFSF